MSAVLQRLLSVQQGSTGIPFFVHIPVDFHCRSGIGRLDNKEELVVPEISLHGIVPCLIPDIQKVCQDLDIDHPSALFAQAVPKLVSRFFKFSRIGLLPLSESFQLVPGRFLFLSDLLELRLCILQVFFQASAERSQALLQTKESILIYILRFEPFNIPDRLIRRHILLLPLREPFCRLLPPCSAVPEPFHRLVYSRQLLFQRRVTAVRDPQDHFLILFPEFFLLFFRASLHRLYPRLLLRTLRDPVLQLTDLFPHLQDLQLLDLIITFFDRFISHRIVRISFGDLLEMTDLAHRLLDLAAHPPILHDTFLQILDMDILLHTDIFFYKILQFDVHTEGNGTFK